MKNNKVLIILVVILGILVLGLGGYIVCDKVLFESNVNNDKTSNNINDNNSSNSVSSDDEDGIKDEDKLTIENFVLENCSDSHGNNYCDEFDKSKALTILNNYKNSGGMFISNLDENIKNEVVVESLDGKIGLCQDYYEKFPNREENVYCFENDKVEVIKYDDFLNKKKELFGSSSKLEKTKFSYGSCGYFNYLSDIDSFVFAGSEGCGGVYSVSSGIMFSYVNDEKLYIVSYGLAADMDFVNEVFLKGYTFEKENGNYYLADVVDLK